jgi:hypothetical protein
MPGLSQVWTAGRSRKGGVGRWHHVPDCWAMTGPKLRRERTEEEARALGYWECPYCCAPPPCCALGTHTGLTLPLLAPAETPEWEAELGPEGGPDE